MRRFTVHKKQRALIFLILMSLVFLPPSNFGLAAGMESSLPLVTSEITSTYQPYEDHSGLWIAPEDWSGPAYAPSASLHGGTSSDNFGYSYDDTQPVEWVDATSGTDSGLSGHSNGQYTGPVDLGFTFPFYENTYDQVFIAASGFITFDDAGIWPNQSQIPASGAPNNVIAPYWAPLYLSDQGPDGRIFYQQGGEAPDRYFVVEWAAVAGGSPDDPTGGDDLFHFQVILFEDGDLFFQYQSMTYVGSSYCGTAGIEDSRGEDGLNYLPFCSQAPPQRAVHFSRPAPAPRVRISPPIQSDFLSPGEAALFTLDVSNFGDLGPDTFDLSATAEWPLVFLAADGSTPLTDTNNSGVVDTGSIDPGQTRQIVVKIDAPPNVPIGAGDQPVVKATSSIEAGRSQAVTLQVAVPARFTQLFRDDADGAMSLLLSQPQNHQIEQATPNAWWGYNPAIIETSSGNYMYAWQRYRYRAGQEGIVAEIETALLDFAGNVLKPASRLSDHGGANQDIYDEEPVLAAAPDGTLALAWRRRILRETATGIQENVNVYLALLNNDGSLRMGPRNLTQIEAWYQDDPITYDVPRFNNIRIASNQKNHFALTWHQESQEAPSVACSQDCKLNDIYLLLMDSDGRILKQTSPITMDFPGKQEGYSSPAITDLTGDRWALVYNHNPGGLALSVLDLQGNFILRRSFVGRFGWSPTVYQPKGSDLILIAWTAWTSNNPQVRLLRVDSRNYQRVSGSEALLHPAAATGGDFASLTTDALGNTILTWMDFSSRNRRNLYYALLDQAGQWRTPPMVLLSADGTTGNSLHIETGFSGYSNTTNRQFTDVPVTHWAAGWIERLYDAGVTTGCQLAPPQYCPTETTTRAQMAVLLGRAIYGPKFAPPTPTGDVFADVPAGYWAAAWIEQLYSDGLTRGCDTDPLRYCPQNNITRAEMAVFLVRVLHGQDYIPPAPTGLFEDVPATHWAAPWIEQLYRDGITTGCSTSPLRFCPKGSTTRAEIAAFLVRTFDVP